MKKEQALAKIKDLELKTFAGDQPHESYNGWFGFLETVELRGAKKNVLWFGVTNCNYFVLLVPEYQGYIIPAFGHMAKVLFQAGNWKIICEGIKEDAAEVSALNEMLKETETSDPTMLGFAKQVCRKNAFMGNYFDIYKVIEKHPKAIRRVKMPL